MVKVFRSIARIIAALVVLLTLSSCGQPGPAPLPTATAPVQGETLTISYAGLLLGNLDKDQKARFDESLAYMHRLLHDRGWDIDFTLEGIAASGENPGQSAVDMLKAAVAVGNAADGYVVMDEAAKALLSAGLTVDPRGVLAAAAPAFYDRYRVIIDGGAAGVPLATNLFDRGQFIVLCLEKAAAQKAGGSIEGLSDVLTFLEDNDDIRIGAFFQTGSDSLLGTWAGEQGYYLLDDAGIGAQLCARLGDESCKVVPIEDIPGFDEFLPRCLKLAWDGRFTNDYNAEGADGKAVVGYIGWLNNDMGYQFLQSHNKTGADYLAFPLKGCMAGSFQPGEPKAFFQLALYSAAKASGLAKFVEWVLLDEQNYRLLRCGAEDVDYRLVDGRVEYLNYRQPLRLEDWGGETKAFFRNYLCPFADISMERATVYGPANYAEVTAAAQPLSMPVYGLLGGWSYSDEVIRSIGSQFGGVASRRGELLSNSSPGDGSTVEDYAAKCLIQLRGLRVETDEMIAAYQARVDELLAARGTAAGK